MKPLSRIRDTMRLDLPVKHRYDANEAHYIQRPTSKLYENHVHCPFAKIHHLFGVLTGLHNNNRD